MNFIPNNPNSDNPNLWTTYSYKIIGEVDPKMLEFLPPDIRALIEKDLKAGSTVLNLKNKKKRKLNQKKNSNLIIKWLIVMKI